MTSRAKHCCAQSQLSHLSSVIPCTDPLHSGCKCTSRQPRSRGLKCCDTLTLQHVVPYYHLLLTDPSQSGKGTSKSQANLAAGASKFWMLDGDVPVPNADSLVSLAATLSFSVCVFVCLSFRSLSCVCKSASCLILLHSDVWSNCNFTHFMTAGPSTQAACSAL